MIDSDSNIMRDRPYRTYRIIGYIITMALHIFNIYYMLNILKASNDPELVYYYKYQLRMYTVWNFVSQSVYAGLGIWCELLSWNNKGKDNRVLKGLKETRKIFFSGVIFPSTLTTFIFFWTICTYDSSYMLPTKLLNALPSISNHVMHTFILPVVLWEMAFSYTKKPESHILNLTAFHIYLVVFFSLFLYTRYESGKFPYPIMDMLYGTPYLVLLFLAVYLLIYICYCTQWPIREYMWGSDEKTHKNK